MVSIYTINIFLLPPLCFFFFHYSYYYYCYCQQQCYYNRKFGVDWLPLDILSLSEIDLPRNWKSVLILDCCAHSLSLRILCDSKYVFYSPFYFLQLFPISSISEIYFIFLNFSILTHWHHKYSHPSPCVSCRYFFLQIFLYICLYLLCDLHIFAYSVYAGAPYLLFYLFVQLKASFLQFNWNWCQPATKAIHSSILSNSVHFHPLNSSFSSPLSLPLITYFPLSPLLCRRV